MTRLLYPITPPMMNKCKPKMILDDYESSIRKGLQDSEPAILSGYDCGFSNQLKVSVGQIWWKAFASQVGVVSVGVVALQTSSLNGSVLLILAGAFLINES
jgi:hypothetical protein